ncbi:MAG: ParB/RepB/Spo0J family partition protein [Candidatus Vogelbacteria bacterium]|nr:ParB/RepB/Spo0J family partition protein [Candidatus Vogelbacteria bacterium]
MEPNATLDNSIYWVEVEKITPNPYQPRRDFDEARLRDLADSIRQYGILQPLVVTRMESEKDDGGIAVAYELIAGERRLRASKIAGIKQVPVLIRIGDQSDKMKLELAIIENLQREDLSPIDRALAFKRLVDEFRFKHTEIAKKIGMSREYVSNSIRILGLPDVILCALRENKIREGHTRPLLMLSDQPQEQITFFKEIMAKGMNVRESEDLSRRIAYHRVRSRIASIKPEVAEMEEKLTECLGTRVQIDVRNMKEGGGRIHIDFFSNHDLQELLERMVKKLEIDHEVPDFSDLASGESPAPVLSEMETSGEVLAEDPAEPAPPSEKEDDGMYSVSSFTI